VLRTLRRAAAAAALAVFLSGGAAAVLKARADPTVPPQHASRIHDPPVLETGVSGLKPQARKRPAIRWRRSVAVGLPWAGSLVDGVRLPVEGRHYVTWDPIRRRSPNRAWRLFGTDRLVRTLLAIAAGYAAAHPDAPPLLIGDLSRPDGGDFGARYGLPGHVSHQNGLDADVYFPRLDRRQKPPKRPGQIDRRLAQDLVDRFVRAGAVRVFVGPGTGLTGPRGVVEILAHHDNHLHVRLAARPVRTHVLGHSVRGRPIRAIAVGDAVSPTRILVVGCIHGDECAGIAVARRLTRLRPPATVAIWIVPNLNPDGLAARTRQNAHGVDLNRNFPAGWRAVGRPFDLTYPGPRAFSEREARIAARLILRLRPRYTVWYHQPQALVRGWDGSRRAARRYARLVGMPYRALPSPPGAATRWQHRWLPRGEAFVVELAAGPLSRAAALRHARAVLRLPH
jgi:protein MpaA